MPLTQHVNTLETESGEAQAIFPSPEWNATARDYPDRRGLQELFESAAEKFSDNLGVEFPKPNGASEKLTYRALNERANQLARHLQRLGVGPDVIVGVCAERSIEMVLAVLAIIKAGGAYAAFDPDYPKERLAFMLEDTKAPIILTQDSLAKTLPQTGAKLLCLDTDWKSITHENSENLPCLVTPENLAYLIYTSGSTGRPKGVAMRQEPLINLLHWQMENWSSAPDARTLQFASLNFDVSFQEIFSTLCSGGTLVLISDEERRDSNALVSFLQTHKVQRLFLPFVALKHLADAAKYNGIYPQHLREIITAGEQLKITPQLVHLFKKLNRCTLENQYGPSETHVVTAYRLQGSPENWPTLPSIGHPIANVKTYILDDNQNPVPVGEAGELYLGGVCLARGYLNRPEITAEKFVEYSIEGEPERLYKSGDLARFLPDGNIEFLGRIDHQVKIRGFRVELGEIEAVLSKHPSVRESVATARENTSGEKQIVAYIVPQDGTLRTKELREFLKGRVPPYAVPSAFVVLPKLPLTPNGKVDRRALPEPTEIESENNAEIKLPRNPLEMQIKLIFEKQLRRRPISIDASFFELGGDSLQALKLIVEIERATGKKFPLSILYQASTVEELARIVREKSQGHSESSLVPLQPLGSKPPLFLVHTTPGDVLGYGNLIYHLETDQPAYGFQSLGFHQPEKRHTRIEEMAAYYVQLLRAQQPRGPYFLGGWCYGGIVAVEMAHQLLAAGQSVAPLFLIETPAPAPSLKNLLYFLRRMGCALNMTPRDWQIYLREKARYYRGIQNANEKRFQRVSTDDGLAEREMEEQNRLLEQLETVYEPNLRALDFYKSRFYPGKIILFNADEPDPALVRDPKYGWLGLAAEIEIHAISGSHDTVLMEPHVQMLAAKMTECLQKIRTNLGVENCQSIS